jgi:hypothetical protein
MQISKSKKGFHLLSFIFPNLDFSKSYERKNKKALLSLNSRDGLWMMVSNSVGRPSSAQEPALKRIDSVNTNV